MTKLTLLLTRNTPFSVGEPDSFALLFAYGLYDEKKKERG
jgi:hypothetical protein